MNTFGISKKINRGIILAAGDGDRMGELTRNHPKVLIQVKREPLILSPIRAFANAGIRNVAIVVGYLSKEIEHKIGDGSQYGVNICYIENEEYSGGNAVSIWKAKPWIEREPVVLCMGDHLINANLVWILLNAKPEIDTLCIDSQPALYHNIEEATKVSLFENGRIREIGKDLLSWDALDTGVFFLTDRFFNAINKAILLYGKSIEISDVIRFMLTRSQQFSTCDVSGSYWMDVDSKEDLVFARSKNE